MARICPICGRVHKYNNIECLRRSQITPTELVERVAKLEEQVKYPNKGDEIKWFGQAD